MVLNRNLILFVLTTVAFAWFISPVSAYEGNPALYDAKYYIDSTASNGGNGKTWATAWSEFSDINWDNVRDDLVNGAVAVYFRGNFSKQLTILGENCSVTNYGMRITCTEYNTDYNTNNRLYVGKHPDYSSPVINATSLTFPILFGKSGYITIAGWTVNGNLDKKGQSLIVGVDLESAPAVSRGHVHILNNTLSNAGQYSIILKFSGDYNIIEGNTIRGGNNGIYIAEERKSGGPHYSQYGVIRNNTITDMDPNRIYNYDAHFVGLQAGKNYIVEDNKCDGTGNVGFALWCWANWARNEGNVVRNNVLKDTWKAGISLRAESAPTKSSYGNLIYQNTLTDTCQRNVGTPQGAFHLNELLVESGKSGTRVFNNTVYKSVNPGIYAEDLDEGEFFNNIFNITGTGQSPTRFILVNSTASKIDSDRNLYLLDGLNASGSYWEFNGLKNWSTYRGKESNSPTPLNDSGDSVWVNAGSGNFDLRSTSAARNAGSYLTSVASISGSGTELYVEDAASLHGNWNLKRADGSAVDGMLVTFYDNASGGRWQDAEIIAVNHDSNKIILDSRVTWIRNASHKDDPAHTTQIALRFKENRPDIGAFEFNSSAIGKLGAPKGVSVQFVLN